MSRDKCLQIMERADRFSIYGHQRTAPNSQGYRGIYFDREHSKWRSEIKFRGKRIKLGRFTSPEAAARAYNDAARKCYGDFAIINDIGRSRTISSLPEPLKRVKRRLLTFYEKQKQRHAHHSGCDSSAENQQ